ncbi:MAG TPA: DUF2946 family protein [Gammaproteobacteria bacterium]|nr:DUF2946 family protein [Gammaproteobacteria bacterium]
MRQPLMHRCRYALRDVRWRRLFLALAAVIVLVQTGFPAHQDSHPIGSPDNQCQYCVLAGHAFGVPSVAILPPSAPVHAERPLIALIEFHVPAFPRTRFSRAPPSRSVV